MASAAPTARRLRSGQPRWLLVGLLLFGCDGGLLNLGNSAARIGGDAGSSDGLAGARTTAGNGGAVGEWSPPQLLLPQDGLLRSNPTLTADEQSVFYTVRERGDDKPSAIYFSQATDWSKGVEVLPGGTRATNADYANPAISPEGTELWFGQAVAGGLGETDIWLSRRDDAGQWGAPEPVGAPLNSSRHDVPRPPSVNGTLMPLASQRHGSNRYWIYLASRATAQDPWDAVSRDLLGPVNIEGAESVDGFLSADGLTLYFSSTPVGGTTGNLFVARRPRLDATFGEPEAIADLNTGADERDPWLSSDGNRLYFSSDRETLAYPALYSIYVSERIP